MNIRPLSTIEERQRTIEVYTANLRSGKIGIQKYNAFMRGISLMHKISMDKMLVEEFREQAAAFSDFISRYSVNSDTLKD